MTSIEPIIYEGKEIVPLQFLKAVLPDPSSLGPRTKGKDQHRMHFPREKRRKREELSIFIMSATIRNATGKWVPRQLLIPQAFRP